MTPRDIIGLWRLRYGDAVEPFYWSDEELLGYVREAQDTASTREGFIVDQSSEACLCPVLSGEPLLERHPAILRIRSATLISTRAKLILTTSERLDAEAPGWQDIAATPTHLIPVYDDDNARLYPTPVQDDMVGLSIFRMPIEEVALDAELEIKPFWHQHLGYWVTYRALSKPGDRYDGARSIEAKALFEDAFGVEMTNG